MPPPACGAVASPVTQAQVLSFMNTATPPPLSPTPEHPAAEGATTSAAADDPDAEDMQLGHTSTASLSSDVRERERVDSPPSSIAEKRMSRTGTMNCESKFPTPVSSPIVADTSNIPSLSSLSQPLSNTAAGEERAGEGEGIHRVVTPSMIEVPPPPPVEKERGLVKQARRMPNGAPSKRNFVRCSGKKTAVGQKIDYVCVGRAAITGSPILSDCREFRGKKPIAALRLRNVNLNRGTAGLMDSSPAVLIRDFCKRYED
ncbi:hypothetical protein B0H14DRAFT_2573299 [Mycena olivaceomarginata]|nr:hypothetical protein B0H14DRAFT_2573299 [Mycena olivaceomarginata]